MASSASEVDGRWHPTRPRIGITTFVETVRWGVWNRPVALVPRAYVDAVWRAGGAPVLLPPVPAADDDARADEEGADEEGADEEGADGEAGTAADVVLAGVDGLVLAGGADIDPTRYGAPPHERTTDTRPERDSWEVLVLRAALQRGMPVLGVCRGAQMLNVVLGGTLHQHVPDLVGHDRHRPAPGVHGTVTVGLRRGSRLGGVLGEEVTVPCYHHQALDRLGTGLVPAGWAEDGTVEAIELTGAGYVVGVQWHPEEDATDLRLFDALVQASTGGTRGRHQSTAATPAGSPAGSPAAATQARR